MRKTNKKTLIAELQNHILTNNKRNKKIEERSPTRLEQEEGEVESGAEIRVQFLEASEHKPVMASFRALKLIEQIEGDGDGHLQQIGLMDGVDQSPVVPQPLIPEHPVHHRPGRVRVGSFLQDPDPARLDGWYR